MFRMNSLRAAGLAIAIIFLPTLVRAQSGQVEGNVKMNAEGGSRKPVPAAMVDIYRTDIKGHWSVKTDKNGHFVILGLPLQGIYVFLASAPGLMATWVGNVHITQTPSVDIIADPGDGQTMTWEQLQQAVAQSKSGGGGQPAPGRTLSGADKAKIEAAQKEQQSKAKDAQEIQTGFDQARTHYNAGVELMKASNFQNALSEFELASTVDPSKHAAMKLLAYKANANLAETHYQLGVDLFNKKQRPEAKAHFESAVAAVKKSIALASNDTAENNPSLNSDLVVYYNILGKNAMLLVEHYGAADIVDETVKELDKAEALDTVNKNKWGALKADLYRSAGRTDEAVAAYKKALVADPNNFDALYGLGLTLIAGTERAQIQEGANTLAEFVAKAPPTDKRVPIVKEALEGVKNAYKVEAEKPAPTRRKRP
jgi:tetratricopeptide (TPR) repeat protein